MQLRKEDPSHHQAEPTNLCAPVAAGEDQL